MKTTEINVDAAEIKKLYDIIQSIMDLLSRKKQVKSSLRTSQHVGSSELSATHRAAESYFRRISGISSMYSVSVGDSSLGEDVAGGAGGRWAQGLPVPQP